MLLFFKNLKFSSWKQNLRTPPKRLEVNTAWLKTKREIIDSPSQIGPYIKYLLAGKLTPQKLSDLENLRMVLLGEEFQDPALKKWGDLAALISATLSNRILNRVPLSLWYSLALELREVVLKYGLGRFNGIEGGFQDEYDEITAKVFEKIDELKKHPKYGPDIESQIGMGF